MDNFIDKLAHRFGTQETARANSEADSKRMRAQLSEYDKLLQEMRRVNSQNAELSEKMEALINDGTKFGELKEDEQKLITTLRDLTDEQTRNREAELARMEQERLEREQEKKAVDADTMNGMLDEKFKESEDFVHKENVKVYRNVQAVVVDEIKRQSELVERENANIKSKLSAVVTVSIVSIIVSLGTVAVCVLTLLTAMGIRLF